jgi:hypothetical protein
MNPNHKRLRVVSEWLLLACGVWLIGLGAYFIAVRPPLLPEDLRYMDMTLNQIRIAAPSLESWLSKVFTVLGGFIAGAGVLTVFVASANLRHQPKTTSWSIAVSGSLTVGLMSAANFALESDSRWLLLVPALTWFASLTFYIAACGKNAG